MIKIEGRKLNIQDNERFIGLEGDNKYETRQFEITEARLFNFDFRLEIKRADGIKDIAYLDKAVESDRIVLTWEVLEKNIGAGGWISIQLCANGEHGEAWNSIPEMVHAESSINASEAYPDPLPSEFEQMEQRVTAAKNETLSARDEAVRAVEDIGGIADHIDEVAGGVEETAIEVNGLVGRVEADRIRAETAADGAEGFRDESEQYANQALDNILNGVTAHNQNAESHPHLLSEVVRVEAIARGKASAKVFDTVGDMEAWLLNPENVAALKIGDNLYIRDLDVPDYWWDGEQIQQLEAKAINLDDYYTKAEVDIRIPQAIEQSDYDYLVENNLDVPGKIYYVVGDGELS